MFINSKYKIIDKITKRLRLHLIRCLMLTKCNRNISTYVYKSVHQDIKDLIAATHVDIRATAMIVSHFVTVWNKSVII